MVVLGVEETNRLGEQPGSQVVLFAFAMAIIAEVLLGHLGAADSSRVGIGLGRPDVIPDLLVGRELAEAVPVGLLAAYPAEYAEVAVEVHPGLEQVRGVGEKSRAVSGLGEQFGERDVGLSKALPSGKKGKSALRGMPVNEGKASGHGENAAPCGYSRGAFRIGAVKDDAFFGESVDVGSFHPGIAIAAEIVGPEGIDHHEYDVQVGHPPMQQTRLKKSGPVEAQGARPARAVSENDHWTMDFCGADLGIIS